MKPVLAMIVASLVAFTVSAQETRFYLYGGMSYYGEQPSSLVGSGIGPKAGVGVVIRDSYGVEIAFDRAPTIDAEGLASFRFDDNRYLSVMVTKEFDLDLMGRGMTFIGKAGLSKYWQEFEYEFARGAFLGIENGGNAPRVSAGIKIPHRDNISIVASVDQIFGDDSEAFSASCVVRFDF